MGWPSQMFGSSSCRYLVPRIIGIEIWTNQSTMSRVSIYSICSTRIDYLDELIIGMVIRSILNSYIYKKK